MAFRNMGVQRIQQPDTVKLREGERLYQRTSSPLDSGVTYLRDITPGAMNRADVNRAGSLAAIAEARAAEANAGREQQYGSLAAWQQEKGVDPAMNQARTLQALAQEQAGQQNLQAQSLAMLQRGAGLPEQADPNALTPKDVSGQAGNIWKQAQQQALRKQALSLAASGIGLPDGVTLQDLTEDHLFDMNRRAGEMQQANQYWQNYNNLAKIFAAQAKGMDNPPGPDLLHQQLSQMLGPAPGAQIQKVNGRYTDAPTRGGEVDKIADELARF